MGRKLTKDAKARYRSAGLALSTFGEGKSARNEPGVKKDFSAGEKKENEEKKRESYYLPSSGDGEKRKENLVGKQRGGKKGFFPTRGKRRHWLWGIMPHSKIRIFKKNT